MKLDLNIQLKDLDDKPLEGDAHNMGKILGNHLAASTKTEALKYYDWGRLLYQGKPIDLDRSDYDKVKDFVEKNENFSALIRAQIISAMDKQKSEQEEKPKKDK